ncbi:unnamed protein product [Amoebophrya sp. A25]|nr:unnamed protein product [Amoebophrya sp. A25]|eukprot:GSA25T00008582001.1
MYYLQIVHVLLLPVLLLDVINIGIGLYLLEIFWLEVLICIFFCWPLHLLSPRNQRTISSTYKKH